MQEPVGLSREDTMWKMFFTLESGGVLGVSWSLRSFSGKVPGKTWEWFLRIWSWEHKGSLAWYTPTEKEMLEDYEGVWAASEVTGTEAQLLAPCLPVPGWMFKGKVLWIISHHWCYMDHANHTVSLNRKPQSHKILELIQTCSKGENFRLSSRRRTRKLKAHIEEGPSFNQLTEN